MKVFRKNFETLLKDEETAVAYLKRYFFGDGNPNTKYAGHAFNSLKPFDPYKITAEDLCAVSLLSIRINYSIVQDSA